jgi:hypothetical protein
MVTHVRIGSVENRPALTRLAGKARMDGIKLYRDRAGRYFASSASKPGTLHFLTGYSCDCRGFMTHQQCKHHAALMTALGWVEDKRDPEPEPAAAISPCGECGGLGELQDLEVRQFGRFAMQWATCSTCQGTGKRLLDHAA